jgi:polar amino acid transport system substrate-binding protein
MRKVVGMLSLAGALIAALATSGYAGQTLDRVMKNKMLVEVTDQAYPPFSFVNDKGEVEGFDIDIAKEFAKRLGVGLKVETPSWEIIVAGNWHGRFL